MHPASLETSNKFKQGIILFINLLKFFKVLSINYTITIQSNRKLLSVCDLIRNLMGGHLMRATLSDKIRNFKVPCRLNTCYFTFMQSIRKEDIFYTLVCHQHIVSRFSWQHLPERRGQAWRFAWRIQGAEFVYIIHIHIQTSRIQSHGP